jgi:asparagine synthase (glutamine-hydrolysing)
MSTHAYVGRIINLLNPNHNLLLNMDFEEASRRVQSGDAHAVREIDGQFAILTNEGQDVQMARSIGRPMRYFLAKKADGPCLYVAERISEIAEALAKDGLSDQFEPAYTRMVPAHHVLKLKLIGCPDPNPNYDRYLAPTRNSLPPDLDVIGEAYMGTVSHEIHQWLDCIGKSEPIGVMFSGGIDSGALLTLLYSALLKRGESPARLKAFTLSIDGAGNDTQQAAAFVERIGAPMLLEVVDTPANSLNWREAVRIIEDYKPLDVQAATMGIALCRGIRNRYPEWKWLVDGDGGDENLKDYPIEDNPELTIRSVLNNLMLYHEGWGVHAIKHSLTFSGGQSRGHVRTFAPAQHFGFSGFSPYTLSNVIEVAESIPFIELTDWDHQRLYQLKGEVVRRGVKAITGIDMPTFEKSRFQHGAVELQKFAQLFPINERDYRREFQRTFAGT